MNNKILILLFCFFYNLSFTSAQLPNLSSKEKKKGWVLLFDGQSTNGWKKA